jgi:branched-chain amino acid transport system substrate-binding protein
MHIQLRLHAAAFLCAATMIATAQPTQVVKIGHVAPLSGAQAQYGKDNDNGTRLALTEFNAQGLVIGGRKIRFELMSEDDAADPKQGTAVAQKLCDAKVAGVVGHMNSGSGIPASRIYNDCGIPHITGSATNPSLTRPGYATSFRVIANDDALGAGLAQYAADVLKLKRVAIIDDRSAYGQGVAQVFKAGALARGIQVVDQQFTSDKATDFTAILTAIKGKAPDAIFYGGMGPQAALMLRQMDQLGFAGIRYLGGDGICTGDIAQLSAGARSLGNVVCAVGDAPLARMTGGEAWKKRYDAAYPGQFQLYSPYTYDAARVLVDAMRRADSVDPAVYVARLRDTRLDGITSAISFDARGELKSPRLTFYGYRDGKKYPLE